jgi:hypothetical protein
MNGSIIAVRGLMLNVVVGVLYVGRVLVSADLVSADLVTANLLGRVEVAGLVHDGVGRHFRKMYDCAIE